jgi:HK97 family phage prohead protease
MATAQSAGSFYLRRGVGFTEEMRRRKAGLRAARCLPCPQPVLRSHPFPREGLTRATVPGPKLALIPGKAKASPDFEALRATNGDASVMWGHFAVFNQWTEINSGFEGRFMERFALGAFKKTIREQRNSIRAIFQHGRDPQIGDKPLGAISELREDSVGVYYEVLLLEASYVRDLVLPGLRADLYGASFRFRVIREEIVDDPGRSEWNPAGLPERTVREVQVHEFGPVTFPAYLRATAGVRSRSLTDQFADPGGLVDESTGRLRSQPDTLMTATTSIPRSTKGSRARNSATPSGGGLRPSWYL